MMTTNVNVLITEYLSTYIKYIIYIIYIYCLLLYNFFFIFFLFFVTRKIKTQFSVNFPASTIFQKI